ncbi:hypothetical protein ACQY0O_000333 [Thecaphora frezii]
MHTNRHHSEPALSESVNSSRPDEWMARGLHHSPVLVPRSSPARSHGKRGSQASTSSVRPRTPNTDLNLDHERESSEDSDPRQSGPTRSQLLSKWARRAERRGVETMHEASRDIEGPSEDLATSGSKGYRSPPSLDRAASSPIRRPLNLGTVGSSSSFTAIRATTPQDKRPRGNGLTPQSAPPSVSKQAMDRRSIAAIFEKMQEEREERLRSEQRQRDEKRLQREQERVARIQGRERRRSGLGTEEAPGYDSEPDDAAEAAGAMGASLAISPRRDKGPDTPNPSELRLEGGPSPQPPLPERRRADADTVEAPSDAGDRSTSARARALARVQNAKLRRLSAGGSSFDQKVSLSIEADVGPGLSDSPESSRRTSPSTRRSAIEDSSSSSDSDLPGDGAVPTQTGHESSPSPPVADDEPTEERAPALDASYFQEGPAEAQPSARSEEEQAQSHAADSDEDENEDEDGESLRRALDLVMRQSSQESVFPVSLRVQAAEISAREDRETSNMYLRPPEWSPQLHDGFAFPASRSPSITSSAPSSRGGSLSSSPATSPRHAVHRRQRTSVVSLSRNLPTSPSAAAQAMDRILGGSGATIADDGDVSRSQAASDGPQRPEISVAFSTGETTRASAGDGTIDAERRRRSVRFSPQPEYRSDSGSANGYHDDDDNDDGSPDEMAATSRSGALRVVNPHTHDATASSDADDDGFERQQPSHHSAEDRPVQATQAQISLAPVERALQLEDEALLSRQLHAGLSAPATPNRSVSLHLPGGYVATPASRTPLAQVHGHVMAPSQRRHPQHESQPRPFPSYNDENRQPATLPTSPTLASASSFASVSPSASPSRNMSPAQRQRLEASRAAGRPRLAPLRNIGAAPSRRGTDHRDDDAVASMDESSLSLRVERPQLAYMPGHGPRESTPPRNTIDRGRLKLGARSSDQLPSPCPRHHDFVAPMDVFVEEKASQEDDSVRITMEQILSALKRRDEQGAARAHAPDKGHLERTVGDVHEAAKEVAAALPSRPASGDAVATQLSEKVEAMQAAEADAPSDASLMGRIDTLRGRLAQLLSSLGNKLSRNPTTRTTMLAPTTELRPFYYGKKFVAMAVLSHLLVLWLMLRAAHVRAEHLRYTSYHDPFFPDLYAAPLTSSSMGALDALLGRSGQPHWIYNGAGPRTVEDVSAAGTAAKMLGYMRTPAP